MTTVDMKPCPFCGMAVDLEDPDTLYPNGTGWWFSESLQMRTYHRANDVPEHQRCWSMHCPTPAGGCDAEVSGDSRQEAIDNWNRRAEIPPVNSAHQYATIALPSGENFALPIHTDLEGVVRFVPNIVVVEALDNDLFSLNDIMLLYEQNSLPQKDLIAFWAELGESVDGLCDLSVMEGVTVNY